MLISRFCGHHHNSLVWLFPAAKLGETCFWPSRTSEDLVLQVLRSSGAWRGDRSPGRDVLASERLCAAGQSCHQLPRSCTPALAAAKPPLGSIPATTCPAGASPGGSAASPHPAQCWSTAGLSLERHGAGAGTETGAVVASLSLRSQSAGGSHQRCCHTVQRESPWLALPRDPCPTLRAQGTSRRGRPSCSLLFISKR